METTKVNDENLFEHLGELIKKKTDTTDESERFLLQNQIMNIKYYLDLDN